MKFSIESREKVNVQGQGRRARSDAPYLAQVASLPTARTGVTRPTSCKIHAPDGAHRSDAPYLTGKQLREKAFTLIEITICLSVIVIGLVAVLGVLPAGIDSQRKNRESAIMDMEGNYFLEALRNGATNFVTGRFVDSYTTNDVDWIAVTNVNEVVGQLTRPQSVNRAQVRTVTGLASEKSDLTKDFALKYLMTAEIVPFSSFVYDSNTKSESYNEAQHIRTNLHEIRLTIQWPVLPGPNPTNVGINKKTFRALTSSQLISNTVHNKPAWLFKPTSYIRSGTAQ